MKLESAVTGLGAPEAKEVEECGQGYRFRAPPGALDAPRRVDVVTMADNHGADYPRVGLKDLCTRSGRAR